MVGDVSPSVLLGMVAVDGSDSSGSLFRRFAIRIRRSGMMDDDVGDLSIGVRCQADRNFPGLVPSRPRLDDEDGIRWGWK